LYSVSLAPLVVKDKVIIGVAGGESGIRGFIAAYDAKTGKEVWRFYTVAGPGEFGHETWEPCPENSQTYCDSEAWKHGAGPVWVTGSYDPSLNLTYWGIGNAGPDFNPAQRPGDNLFTCSVVALDADTGKLKWHYQFVPHDAYDFDAVQIPVLADIDWNGAPRKAMLWAHRGGFYYVLDRVTGKFLLGRPFVKVNWASGFSEQGRPIQTPQAAGQATWPGVQGATNWYSPSYSPHTGLFYISAWENYRHTYEGAPAEYKSGQGFLGMGRQFGTNASPIPGAPSPPNTRRGPINTWTEAVGTGAVIAVDARTGEQKWKYPMTDVTDSGILTTASDVLFTGQREGYFHALNARTGELLWKASLGGQIANGPITYQVDGKQYVATIAGHSLVAFALRD
jgi:alcohol dehydrogenase (cytochrome c)